MLTNPTNVAATASIITSIGTAFYVRNNLNKLRKESRRQTEALNDIITELEAQSSTFKAAQKLKKILAFHETRMEDYDNEISSIKEDMESVKNHLSIISNKLDLNLVNDQPKQSIILNTHKMVEKPKAKSRRKLKKEPSESEELSDSEEFNSSESESSTLNLKEMMKKVKSKKRKTRVANSL